jgi:glucan 1,3-beta-glucosidase
MDKIRGVNLGSWFVLERWMVQDLFKNNQVEGKDETKFSKQVPNLEEVLHQHYETFITIDDLNWIKDQGLNLVRIPIPWWLFGQGIYQRSVEYIDRALSWCQELELPFMLDLHTAPGCQNGFDNGGIEGVLEWPNDPKNIEMTLDILEEVTKRYKDNPMFHSICVLNEPFLTVDMDLIQDFYKKAYQIIRNITDQAYVVFHDSFRLHAFEGFIQSNEFDKVILDTHMYQCFSANSAKLHLEDHLKAARNRSEVLKKVSQYVDVMVGEWSLGLRKNETIHSGNMTSVMTLYAQAQIEGMRDCLGHTFWSYKVSDEDGGWHFRRLVERGIINMKELLK